MTITRYTQGRKHILHPFSDDKKDLHCHLWATNHTWRTASLLVSKGLHDSSETEASKTLTVKMGSRYLGQQVYTRDDSNRDTGIPFLSPKENFRTLRKASLP